MRWTRKQQPEEPLQVQEVRFLKDEIDNSTDEGRDIVLTHLLTLPWATIEVQNQ